jgi:hypothetical protein
MKIFKRVIRVIIDMLIMVLKIDSLKINLIIRERS